MAAYGWTNRDSTYAEATVIFLKIITIYNKYTLWRFLAVMIHSLLQCKSGEIIFVIDWCKCNALCAIDVVFHSVICFQ